MILLVLAGSKTGGEVSLERDGAQVESRSWESGPQAGRDLLVGIEDMLSKQNLTARDLTHIRIQGVVGESSAERMIRVTAQTLSASLGIPVEQAN